MTDEHQHGDNGKDDSAPLTPMRPPWLSDQPSPSDSSNRSDGWQKLAKPSPVKPAGDDGSQPPNIPSPSSTAKPQHPTEHPFAFTGSGGEFFRIWIVNIGLTIITLGIYAAWAKVRTKRYFYASTSVAGAPFDYLARPKAILTGNAVAAVALVLYSLSGYLGPLVSGLFWLAFIFLLPVIVTRSLRFRMRNTAWRNIRFGFDGSYKDAFIAYILAPLTILLTLGLSMPWADWVRRRLLFRHGRLGTEKFEIDDLGKAFYPPFLGVMLLSTIGFGLMAVLISALPPEMRTLGSTVMVPVFLIGSLLGNAYIKATITNLMWNHTRVAGNHFRSEIDYFSLFKIYLVNTLAIVFTLGLAIPWAKVRTVAYQIGCLTLVAHSDLDQFAADQRDKDANSAIGEEMGEALGVDIGL